MDLAALRSDDRRTTWLELFYDLVYVIAVAKLTAGLHGHPDGWSVLRFVGLFIVIWWAWVGFAVFATRFDRDDLEQRGLTLAQMLVAIGMAVQVPAATGSGATGFVIAYVLVRMLLMVMYARATRLTPDARPLFHLLGAGFVLGAACWLGSLAVAPPLRWWLWGLGIGVDLALPLLFGRHARTVPVHTAHLPERFGLFTLIVLGESIAAVASGFDRMAWAPATVLAGLGSFVLAAAIWWAYFTYVERAPLQCSLGNGRPYIYWHLPLLMGLTASGVGVYQAMVEAPTGVSGLWTAPFVAGGMLMFWGSFLALQLATYPRPGHGALQRRYWPLLAVLAGVAALGHALSPLAIIGSVTAAVTVVAGLDVRHRQRLPARAYMATSPSSTALGRKTYAGAATAVSFDPGVCIHAGECLRHLPQVFDLAARPWIQPDRATVQAVADAVRRCPSGALRLETATGADPLPAASETGITVVPGGPVHVGGGVPVRGLDGPATTGPLALCRCGRSQAYPMCDGSHRQA